MQRFSRIQIRQLDAQNSGQLKKQSIQDNLLSAFDIGGYGEELPVIDVALHYDLLNFRRLGFAEVIEHGIMPPGGEGISFSSCLLREPKSGNDLGFNERQRLCTGLAVVVKNGMELALVDVRPASRAHVVHQLRLLGHKTNALNDRQVERDGVEPLRGKVSSEGILEGVSGCVVGLLGIASDANGRGEEDEELEAVAQSVVETPGGVNFRPDCIGPLLVRHVFKTIILGTSQYNRS